MNVQYQHVLKKTQRIIRELEEITVEIAEALQRDEQKHALKLAKMQRRAKDAVLYLKDAVQ